MIYLSICMIMFILILISMYILINTLDSTLHRHVKITPQEIFSLSDPLYNYCKLSLGAIPDFNLINSAYIASSVFPNFPAIAEDMVVSLLNS